MGIEWVTFLNDGANVGDHNYLIDKLKAARIELIMRLHAPRLEPIKATSKAW